MTTFCYPYTRGTGWRSQGFRSNPNQGANGAGGHTGFDEAMDAGTPLYAPGDGIVRNSSWVSENYLDNPWWLTQMGGDILVLDCFGADGTTSTGPTFVLAHLSDSIAEVGQRVSKGELIALSGNTGTATTGPHAHIEALPPNWDVNNGVYGRVDPEQYFTEWPEDFGGSGIAAMGGTTTTSIEDDDMPWNDSFDRDVRGSLQNLTNETSGLNAFIIDVRGDLENKGRQIAALTAANDKLASLLADDKGLSVDDVRAALAGAIADGIKVTIG